ncbi:primase-helicase family protein [Pedobacter steynii]
MDTTQPYIRIGTTYYKSVRKPLASGDQMVMLLPWSAECIKQDHGKSYLSTISKYDGFCFVPSHLNYQRIVGNFYNRYYPFNHEPKNGRPVRSLDYLGHIFGDQIEVGLDYLKLLLEKPMQRLPILCLVSSERNTGKTTFLNWLKAIFGDNMTINTNEDFRSNFNAEWAQKVLIGVDETFLERREDSERLKNLSTATFYKAEAKGMDRQEIEFFGKFILCSNNEDTFVIVDPGETRYWVRKIPSLTEDDPHLLAALKKKFRF